MTHYGRDGIKLVLCKPRPAMITNELTDQSPKEGREQKQSCRYFTEGCQWEVMGKLAVVSLCGGVFRDFSHPGITWKVVGT